VPLQRTIEPSGRLWLFAFGYAVGLVILQPLSLMLAPVPVAVYAAQRRMSRAWMFVAVAFFAGQLSLALGMAPLGLPIVLFAMVGFILGWSIRAGQIYRHAVAGTTLALFVILTVMLSLQWDVLEESMSDALVKIEVQIEESDSADVSETALTNLNILKWFLENYRYVLFGNAFGTILVGICFSTTLVYHWLRRYTEIPLTGSFREFRTPDALVWAAITAGLLWLANDRWPGETIQFWSWNLAVSVFVWYWLNGLSLLLYAFAAFKPHPAAALFFVVFLLFLGISFLAVAGLFDTWGNFRKTIDSRAEARKSDDGTA